MQQSLFEPRFDLEAGLVAKRAGMDKAASNKKSLLEHARTIARRLGANGKEVTADDVIRVLGKSLGNAAGSLFIGGEWEFTGRFIKSARVQARGNLLRVWVLKGATK